MPVATERATLVKALSTVALSHRRRDARRFLQGLSTEELRYIASYFGACLLESNHHPKPASREEIAWEVLQYGYCRNVECECARLSPKLPGDVEHKMILLLEYLASCRRGVALTVTAGSA